MALQCLSDARQKKFRTNVPSTREGTYDKTARRDVRNADDGQSDLSENAIFFKEEMQTDMIETETSVVNTNDLAPIKDEETLQLHPLEYVGVNIKGEPMATSENGESSSCEQSNAEETRSTEEMYLSEVKSEELLSEDEPVGSKTESREDEKCETSSFVCSYCSSDFSDRTLLGAHMKVCQTKSTDKKKTHECAGCDYRTHRLQNLKRHMLSHSGERRHECPDCDYRALLKSHLAVHISYKHTKEKPFGCDLCDYKCTQFYMLNKHKMVHLPEKPYACQVCGKGFLQKTYLRMHMYNHSEEQKPFKCADCDYAAPDRSRLKRHRSYRHSGERPFKCGSCDYRCVTAGNLRTHMYTHSSEKQFKCKECAYQCMMLRRLKKHVEKNHK